MCVYIYILVIIYTYNIHLYITGVPGPRALGEVRKRNPGNGGTFFDFGGLFIDKSARSGPPCDGP